MMPTERQRTVLRLRSQGLSNKEIGRELHLAEKTIRNIWLEIKPLYGARNVTEAVVRAIEAGHVSIVRWGERDRWVA